jgi:protein-disulfide isomerase
MREAEAAFCADQQKQFWPMHTQLFTSQPKTESDIRSLAISIGLNASLYDQCMESHAAEQRIRKDVMQAKNLGVNAVPTILINGRMAVEGSDYIGIRAAVKEELRKLQVKSR